jgi:hypothetical protein
MSDKEQAKREDCIKSTLNVNAHAKSRAARFPNNTAFGKTKQAKPVTVLSEDQSLRTQRDGRTRAEVKHSFRDEYCSTKLLVRTMWRSDADACEGNLASHLSHRVA